MKKPAKPAPLPRAANAPNSVPMDLSRAEAPPATLEAVRQKLLEWEEQINQSAAQLTQQATDLFQREQWVGELAESLLAQLALAKADAPPLAAPQDQTAQIEALAHSRAELQTALEALHRLGQENRLLAERIHELEAAIPDENEAGVGSSEPLGAWSADPASVAEALATSEELERLRITQAALLEELSESRLELARQRELPRPPSVAPHGPTHAPHRLEGPANPQIQRERDLPAGQVDVVLQSIMQQFSDLQQERLARR